MLKYHRLKSFISLSILAFSVLTLSLPTAAAKLSPALDIIAAEYTMAKSALVGEDIEFTKEDFTESLGVSSVGKITIATLPEGVTGRLQLGSRPVSVGQVISESNLSALKFVPYGSDEVATSFTFCRGTMLGTTEYECMLYTLDSKNSPPALSTNVTTTSGDLGVYSGITYLGTILASDPDKDSLTFEIVSNPDHGNIKLTDKSRGYYEYTAHENYSGRDSFTVRVTDKYGNRSEIGKVTLRVTVAKDGEVFSDMAGHWANSAVITCVREGVIAGAALNESFYPDEKLSRGEFLYLAMNAAGCGGFSGSYTGFADDGEIPDKYKGAVALADTLGIIDGIETEAGIKFFPNNQITRCEAAVILSRITGITEGEVSVSANDSDIPAWAVGAMQGLHSMGILRGDGNGQLNAYAPLTRGAAVQMLAAAIMQ